MIGRPQAMHPITYAPHSSKSSLHEESMDQKEMEQAFVRLMAAAGAIQVDPQVAGNQATYVRNYYEALITKGFLASEALRIVSAHGLQAISYNSSA
jgi:hypothetical protein